MKGVHTLQEAVELFLGEYDNQLTVRAYSQTLDMLVAALGPARRLDRINAVDVVMFSQDLRDREYSPSTVHKHIKQLKSFFNWLDRLGLVDSNLAKNVRSVRLARSVSKDKAMTDAELHRILEYSKFKPLNNAIIRFLADTGCRAGGVATLELKDVDLDGKKALVREKGDKQRWVWFEDACAHALRIWLIGHRKERVDKYIDYMREEHGEEVGDHGYMFCHSHGPFTSDAISQIVRRACFYTGVRSMGSHSLRHRKGHQLADSGIPPTVAATVLGHTDVTTTLNFYYPADLERAEEAVRNLATKNSESDPTKIVKINFRRP